MFNPWFMTVLNENNLGDWNLEEGEPYCWLSQKKITIYKDSTWVMFLHEVAHALEPEPEPYGLGFHYHGSAWASTFGKLVERYAKSCIAMTEREK